MNVHEPDTGTPATDLADQAGMVEAAARALSFTPWGLAPDDLKRIIRRQAERVLTAALAGRTVIELPDPDDRVPESGAPRWYASGRRVVAKVDKRGRPFIRLNGQLWLVEEAESVGAALVAAAREARRLAEVADDQPE